MTKPIIRPIQLVRLTFFIIGITGLYQLNSRMLSLDEENSCLQVFGVCYTILLLLMLFAKSNDLEKAIYVLFFAIGGLMAFAVAAFSHMGPLFG